MDVLDMQFALDMQSKFYNLPQLLLQHETFSVHYKVLILMAPKSKSAQTSLSILEKSHSGLNPA
jgi:hypothetical protein